MQFPVVVPLPLMQLLSLPSMALRLVANLQFCRSFGVATLEVTLPLILVSATLKQNVGSVVTGFAAACRKLIICTEQGALAKCPGAGEHCDATVAPAGHWRVLLVWSIGP